MVESDGLLNRCRLTPYLGFESRSLRLRRTLGGGLFVCLALFGFSIPSRAQTPASQYRALRKQSAADLSIQLADVRIHPEDYAGKTFEFRGMYRGWVGDEDDPDGVQLLIDNAPMLRMSSAPRWLGQNTEVRVLCVASRVPEGERRTGLPDMVLVAIADASEIDFLEARDRPKPKKPPVTVVSRAAPKGGVSPPGPRPPRFRGPATAAPATPAPGDLRDLSADAQAVYPVYRDYIQHHNRRLTARQAGDITYGILKFSQQWDMDPRLIVATIVAESDFRITERSHAGAMGLIQLMPDEVQRLKLTNPYDPIQNVMGGIFLLKERLNKYSGSGNFKDANMQHIILALASYNAGEGAVKKYKGVPPYRETQGYVRRIEKLYRELCAADGSPG